MRRLILALTLVLGVACGGGSEPDADPVPAAPEPAPAPVPADEGADAAKPKTVPIVGGSKIGLPADWRRVNEFTRMFYDGEFEALYAQFTDGAKEELSIKTLEAMHEGLRANHGEELSVVDTTKEEKAGYRAYKRAARFSKDERLIEVAWVLAADDKIAGLYITPDRSATE